MKIFYIMKWKIAIETSSWPAWTTNSCLFTPSSSTPVSWARTLKKNQRKPFILRGWHLLLWSILPIGPLYFTSPTEDGTAILCGHPSHAKVSPLALQREWLHFSVILRPWVLVRPRESNPRPPALQSTRSTDWANTATFRACAINLTEKPSPELTVLNFFELDIEELNQARNWINWGSLGSGFWETAHLPLP